MPAPHAPRGHVRTMRRKRGSYPWFLSDPHTSEPFPCLGPLAIRASRPHRISHLTTRLLRLVQHVINSPQSLGRPRPGDVTGLPGPRPRPPPLL